MSKLYTSEATVTIEGDEVDVRVRGLVDYGPSHGGWAATLDGDPEVRHGETWRSVYEWDLDARDIAHVTEVLEEECCNDDSLANGAR